MAIHREFHFSITIHTNDMAVLHCLRGLSGFAQKSEGPHGGTENLKWWHHHHHATFHFTSAEYRSGFESEAERLLPADSWYKVVESDIDPANS